MILQYNFSVFLLHDEFSTLGCSVFSASSISSFLIQTKLNPFTWE